MLSHDSVIVSWPATIHATDNLKRQCPFRIILGTGHDLLHTPRKSDTPDLLPIGIITSHPRNAQHGLWSARLQPFQTDVPSNTKTSFLTSRVHAMLWDEGRQLFRE